MAENSLLGGTIVTVIGLVLILVLPSRILGVWRGERPAPSIPLRKRDRYFLGREVFDVTDRNFPAFGTAILCMGGFALLLGASVVVAALGFPVLNQPLVGLAVVLLALAFLFAIFSQIIFLTGRPKSLIPPGEREQTTQTEEDTDLLNGAGSLSSGGDTDSTTNDAGDDELEFDFTNEEVQQLLRTDDELLENLDGWVDDDLARVVHDGEAESHYAVLDIWWSQIAEGLGYEPPDNEDDFGEYTVMVALTSAYQNHADRVGEYPDIENNISGTSPFVVEHSP